MFLYTLLNNIKLWNYAKTTSRLSRKLQRQIKNEQKEADKRQKTYLIPVVRKSRITDNWINNKPKGIKKPPIIK